MQGPLITTYAGMRERPRRFWMQEHALPPAYFSNTEVPGLVYNKKLETIREENRRPLIVHLQQPEKEILPPEIWFFSTEDNLPVEWYSSNGSEPRIKEKIQKKRARVLIKWAEGEPRSGAAAVFNEVFEEQNFEVSRDRIQALKESIHL